MATINVVMFAIIVHEYPQCGNGNAMSISDVILKHFRLCLRTSGTTLVYPHFVVLQFSAFVLVLEAVRSWIVARPCDSFIPFTEIGSSSVQFRRQKFAVKYLVITQLWGPNRGQIKKHGGQSLGFILWF